MLNKQIDDVVYLQYRVSVENKDNIKYHALKKRISMKTIMSHMISTVMKDYHNKETQKQLLDFIDNQTIKKEVDIKNGTLTSVESTTVCLNAHKSLNHDYNFIKDNLNKRPKLYKTMDLIVDYYLNKEIQANVNAGNGLTIGLPH